ncbi:MAG: transcription termination factor NusA [Planctomycetales bacterium]|nr:transcription termination factor NusA [bacterium]UNM08378.1 MAG: transcription termination factor NusA [Planctomycetales bacterium]
MKLDPQFAAAIQEIETTRGIPRDRIVDALRQGFEAAYEKNFGSASNLEVEVNLRTGVIEAYLTKTVVEDVQDENEEISLAEAREVEEGAEIGDSLGFEADMTSLGNLAIHTFKQKLKSLIKDAERDKVMRLYGDRIFEMINCTVLFVERGDVYVETPDKVEGIIAYKEQIPRERLNPGQRVKCLLTEVRNVRKAPMLVFSRTHADLLRELMKNEVPEVREGNIEIVAISRDPGYRAKVAVRSKLPELDPVGSCIGSRGIRITAISHDVNDEKIDLVLWKEDPFEFIAEALSPAKVMSVEIFEEERKGIVVVPDDQISLAIGKGWRNVKLASKLTRYFLDVKSQSEMAESGGDMMREDDGDDYIDDDDDDYIDEPEEGEGQMAGAHAGEDESEEAGE